MIQQFFHESTPLNKLIYMLLLLVLGQENTISSEKDCQLMQKNADALMVSERVRFTAAEQLTVLQQNYCKGHRYTYP